MLTYHSNRLAISYRQANSIINQFNVEQYKRSQIFQNNFFNQASFFKLSYL